MGKSCFALALGFFLCLSFTPVMAEVQQEPAEAEINIDHLSLNQIKMVDAVLKKLAPLINKRQASGSLATFSFEDLYLPVSNDEKDFLEKIRSIGPGKVGVKTPYLGLPKENPNLVRLEKQPIRKNKQTIYLETQYVPRNVHESYLEMMEAMEKDLGKRLYVASGYRSPAYQWYLFLSFLPKHHYSIRETASLNAFPGYSEHGYPTQQALDFVSQDGVDGEDSPESFEALEEYQWLLKHAARHHFALSYPKNNPSGIAFEPWHWHYEKNSGHRS